MKNLLLLDKANGMILSSCRLFMYIFIILLMNYIFLYEVFI